MTSVHLAHPRRRIVVTGGPGAGKTATLELARQAFCDHVGILPEAASILFRGGFTRGHTDGARAAAQRAIFHVQRELEEAAAAEGEPLVVICDRGTVDGVAYWPGPGDFWSTFGTTREAELGRYDLVLHLRTPTADGGYNHDNPARIETAAEAALIDERIALAWRGHPSYFVVPSTGDFLDKARRALTILRAWLPACCRREQPHVPHVSHVPHVP